MRINNWPIGLFFNSIHSFIADTDRKQHTNAIITNYSCIYLTKSEKSKTGNFLLRRLEGKTPMLYNLTPKYSFNHPFIHPEMRLTVDPVSSCKVLSILRLHIASYLCEKSFNPIRRITIPKGWANLFCKSRCLYNWIQLKDT